MVDLHFTGAWWTCISQVHGGFALHSCLVDLQFTAAWWICISQLDFVIAFLGCPMVSVSQLPEQIRGSYRTDRGGVGGQRQPALVK